jgi:hypothetical protein
MLKKILFVAAGLAVGAVLIALLNPRAGRAQVVEETEQPRQEAQNLVPLNNGQDPNEDIKVTPQIGEWMVCIASYTGPEAHAWARQMVAELRGPRYRLPAYVFNQGLEKQLQEKKRVEDYMNKQREMMLKFGQTQGKIRVRTMKFEEQVAVLIGGYQDDKTAKRAMNEMQKMPIPDKDRVHMDTEWIINQDKKTGDISGTFSPVNPFTHSFVVRNPSLPPVNHQDNGEILRTLQSLNSNEPYSLLKCRKRFTLAIKEFRMPTVVHQDMAPKSILSKFGWGGDIKQDQAAESAHNLAKFLRNKVIGGLRMDETFVLHNRNYSMVTVGSFDGPDDPQLIRYQERLAEALPQMVMQGQPGVGFYPVPVPFPVPR